MTVSTGHKWSNRIASDALGKNVPVKNEICQPWTPICDIWSLSSEHQKLIVATPLRKLSLSRPRYCFLCDFTIIKLSKCLQEVFIHGRRKSRSFRLFFSKEMRSFQR